jgi:uncharacterized protein (TIGR02266 family)
MSVKILLVDDVTMFLELQKDFLKRSAVTILTATNGAEALQICKAEHPALIFMDLHMPVMSGDECCKALKADAELKKIPVIMTTSEGKTADQALCFSSGCDDFITKPLDRNIFLQKARRFRPEIDRREARVGCLLKTKFRAYGVNLSGSILDISTNGVYLEADYDVQPGTAVELVFALPNEDGAMVQASGKVAWTNTGGHRTKLDYPPGFGVEFTNINEESKKALARFIASRHGYNLIL